MMDRSFHLADMAGDPDALNAIRRLEERLSDSSGTDIALVAYAADEDEIPDTNL